MISIKQYLCRIDALLLGKLKKSPYDAIKAYMSLESVLSAPPTDDEEERSRNSGEFERAFEEVLIESGISASTSMLDKDGPKTCVNPKRAQSF